MNLRSLRYDDPILADIAEQAAQALGVPANLLNAIRMAEKSKNSYVKSGAGAQGIYQFIPSTAKAYELDDPTDPVASTFAAARYLKDLLKQYGGDAAAAAAHYNGGSSQGKLVAAGKDPTKRETLQYVKMIRNSTEPPTTFEAKKTRAGPYEVPDNNPPSEPGLASPDPLQLPPSQPGRRGPNIADSGVVSDPYGIGSATGGGGPSFQGQSFGDLAFDTKFGGNSGAGSETFGFSTEPDYGVPRNRIENIDPGVALTAELRKIVDSVVG